MKVLVLTNIPSPYRIDFFNEWGRSCELTVIFERESSSERDNSWKNVKIHKFNGIILKGLNVSVDKALCLSVLKYLKRTYDFIIVQNALTPTGILAITYLKTKRIPFIIEGDGGNTQNTNGIKRIIKNLVYKNAYAYFSPSDSLDNYYRAYGAKKENIYRYPFTSIWDKHIQQKDELPRLKSEAKEHLGVKEGKIILTVGQFIHRKGIDILLKAASSLQNNVRIFIIGGIPTSEYMELVEQYCLTNITFMPFQEFPKLERYYLAADIFVLPTRFDAWGLVINEAMAYGLPVISTNMCIAAVQLIKNGENGFVIETDQVKQLAEKVNILLADYALRDTIMSNNLDKIRGYTIEKMAECHNSYLNEFKEGLN